MIASLGFICHSYTDAWVRLVKCIVWSSAWRAGPIDAMEQAQTGFRIGAGAVDGSHQSQLCRGSTCSSSGRASIDTAVQATAWAMNHLPVHNRSSLTLPHTFAVRSAPARKGSSRQAFAPSVFCWSNLSPCTVSAGNGIHVQLCRQHTAMLTLFSILTEL